MDLNSSYDELSSLLNANKFSGFGMNSELQHLAIDKNNIIFTVYDKSGKQYNAEVAYNSATQQISHPSYEKQISQFELLPPDNLIEIMLNLSLKDVDNICSLSSHLTSQICDNETYWQRRYIKDFGEPIDSLTVTNWKEQYKERANVFTKLTEDTIAYILTGDKNKTLKEIIDISDRYLDENIDKLIEMSDRWEKINEVYNKIKTTENDKRRSINDIKRLGELYGKSLDSLYDLEIFMINESTVFGEFFEQINKFVFEGETDIWEGNIDMFIARLKAVRNIIAKK